MSIPLPGQQATRSTNIQAAGERVGLRPFRENDRARVEPWYGEAARTDPSGDRLAITLRGDDAPIGVVDFRIGYPVEGWLTIGFVGVATRLRGRGYGSEAVRLLEGEVRRRGLVRRFRAEVDRDNGLGIYFWLRLGYRPEPADDIIAMVRTVRDPSLRAGA